MYNVVYSIFLFSFFYMKEKTLAYLFGWLTDLISFGAYTQNESKNYYNQEDIADIIH